MNTEYKTSIPTNPVNDFSNNFFKSLMLIVFLMISSAGYTQVVHSYKNSVPQHRLSYFETHEELVISIMKSHKIPASITFAQAVIESNCGTSPLAKISNNQFGIKRKSGDTKFVEHPERLGEYYRAYETVEESIIDHANFLANRIFYKPLFNLDIMDYKAWAHGLLECGYATDPEYPNKLIRIIETHNLQLYDLEYAANY